MYNLLKCGALHKPFYLIGGQALCWLVKIIILMKGSISMLWDRCCSSTVYGLWRVFVAPSLPFCLTCFTFANRIQQEIQLKLLEEETAKRIEEAIRKNVEEKLNSEEIKLEIERRKEEGQKKLYDDVAAKLKKEKEMALTEARQKEVSISLLYFSWGVGA